MVGRSPEAARQLASRARRRVKGADVTGAEPDVARQRQVVDAFLTAAARWRFRALVAVLHPDVVLRADSARSVRPHPPSSEAPAVARRARLGASPAAELHPALVNGAAGVVIAMRGRPYAVMGFTVAGGQIVAIDVVADPERVRRVAATVLTDG